MIEVFNLQETSDPDDLMRDFFGKANAFDGFQSAVFVRHEAQRIPKVFHQIWLGSPLPARLKRLRQTWIQHHPDWEFKLWTDEHLKIFMFRELLESTSCYGQKSDVLRAEILHRFGGVYVDLDFECFQPISPWLAGRDFFAGLRWIMQAHLGWPSVWSDPLVICNSLFAAEAEHPILGSYLSRVQSVWNDRQRLDLKTDELDRISVSVMGGVKRAAHIKETGLRTYLPFHDAVYEARANTTIAPPSFFNPLISQWPGVYLMPQFWQTKKKSHSDLPRLWRYSKVQRHSIACHLSKATWL